MFSNMSFSGKSAAMHYGGISLILCILGIVYLTKLTLTVEGNDIAQAGILIGILGTVASGIMGLMSGIVLGRHFAAQEQEKK